MKVTAAAAMIMNAGALLAGAIDQPGRDQRRQAADDPEADVVAERHRRAAYRQRRRLHHDGGLRAAIEPDHRDESLCPHDIDRGAQLLDDELAAIFAKMPEDVRLSMIADSCHSGTVTRSWVRQAFSGRTNRSAETNSGCTSSSDPLANASA